MEMLAILLHRHLKGSLNHGIEEPYLLIDDLERHPMTIGDVGDGADRCWQGVWIDMQRLQCQPPLQAPSFCNGVRCNAIAMTSEEYQPPSATWCGRCSGRHSCAPKSASQK